jgi:uncharacterized protein YpmS
MNKWKVAFLLLLGLVLLAVAAVIYLILGPVEQVQKPAGGNATGSMISIETTAQEFETIARQYIGPSLKNSPMPVDFAINDEIQLFSTFTIFTVDVPITMDFEPIVEENGNITLQQTTMNVGKLNIPPSSVLKLLKDSVDFPDWITVNANEALIYVDLSRINIANGSRVRAKQIDLATDKIELEIIVPNE